MGAKKKRNSKKKQVTNEKQCQPTSPRPSLVYNHFEEAICLFALVNRREPDTAEPVNAGEKHTNNLHGDNELDDVGIPEKQDSMELELEELTMLAGLRDKFLACLAEVLARFKTDHKLSKSSGRKMTQNQPERAEKVQSRPDASHVASTMMFEYGEQEKVKILYSKNEGLDDDDIVFMKKWKDCMESVASASNATEDHKSAMFELVFDHQRPRITTYFERLKDAFKLAKKTERSEGIHMSNPTLSSSIGMAPMLKTRKWVDDKGLEYEIPISFQVDAGEKKQTEPESTEYSTEIDVEVTKLFVTIKTLNDGCNEERQDELLKDLIKTSFNLWRGARSRSAVKARLHVQLGGNHKARKSAELALISLCKIFCHAHTFIRAAEKIPGFKRIELIPISPKMPSFNLSGPTSATCVTALDLLGITSAHSEWHGFFESNKADFTSLKEQRREKDYFHAEIQALHYYNFSSSPEHQKDVYPYIGCSKLCCTLCYWFISLHGKFRVRGTHETVFHRWNVPLPLTKGDRITPYELATSKLLEHIKRTLGEIFNTPRTLKVRELLAQSSAAVSSAQLMIEEEKAKLERSNRWFERLMTMPTAAGSKILVVRLNDKPGYACVFGGTFTEPEEMTLENAESIEAQHIEQQLQLQQPNVVNLPGRCFCENISSYRCAACRKSYCSIECQKKDWRRRHAFVCCVKGRPNDVDRLGFMIRRLKGTETALPESFFVQLYSDDDLCRTFGFNTCIDKAAVGYLVSIYRVLLKGKRISDLQFAVYNRTLEAMLQSWARTCAPLSSPGQDADCFWWIILNHMAGNHIPNPDGSFAYQMGAFEQVFDRFQVWQRFQSNQPLSSSERKVLELYALLFRDFNNIPEIWNSEWIEFGFCYCVTDFQRKAVAKAYIQLADAGTPLSVIALAFEESMLEDLMRNEGVDITLLEAEGIFFHKPDTTDFGIYRLMSEVSHILMGCYCFCFRSVCSFRSKYEIMCKESEGEYGFHGTDPWERWQLLNFYSHVFSIPAFRPREMEQARHDADPEALEIYLNRLVPDFQRKIENFTLADAMFPKLRSTVSFPNGKLVCECVIHRMMAPSGLIQ